MSQFIALSVINTELFFFFFTSVVLAELLHPNSVPLGTYYGVTHGWKKQEGKNSPTLNSQECFICLNDSRINTPKLP